MPPGRPALRRGRSTDLAALLALEAEAFATERVSRRSFRRHLRSPSAVLIVAPAADGLAGYALVLFRAGSSVARLYSLAVAGRARGQGLGRLLLEAAERTARRSGCDRLRLEVSEGNERALALYHRHGYRPIATLPAYYADGSAALRMERPLRKI